MLTMRSFYFALIIITGRFNTVAAAAVLIARHVTVARVLPEAAAFFTEIYFTATSVLFPVAMLFMADVASELPLPLDIRCQSAWLQMSWCCACALACLMQYWRY